MRAFSGGPEHKCNRENGWVATAPSWGPSEEARGCGQHHRQTSAPEFPSVLQGESDTALTLTRFGFIPAWV